MLSDAGLALEDLRTLGKSSSDARVGKLAATGGADDIVEQTHKMLKAGVDHVCFGHPLSEDPMRAVTEIGEEVIAHFQQ